jgi:hypothetical protein
MIINQRILKIVKRKVIFREIGFIFLPLKMSLNNGLKVQERPKLNFTPLKGFEPLFFQI